MMKNLLTLMLAALMLLTAVPALAESSSSFGTTINITFEFRDQEATDLDQLNAMLATLPLTDLSMKDLRGYLCTTTQYEKDGETVQSIAYRYGLRQGVLVCELPSKRDDLITVPGDIYRFDQAVFPIEANMDSDAFVAQWNAEHPDRVIRLLYSVGFENHTAFLYAHHERTAE